MSEAVRPEGCVYKLISLLGEGLTSRVFAAVREDSRGFSRQRVVLKILKAETDLPWLKREFRILSNIRSPHCVRILGWENFSEGPALVLEHIDGVSLAELASAKKLDASEVDEITAQIQDGLRTLHESGICHGDLSPANVMIDREGILRLIDFAIGTSENGHLVGTPTYMAPEIWSAQPVSPASDLFSLGLIRHDLAVDFALRPIEPKACRDRSADLAGSGCPLLASQAAERTLISLCSNPDVRWELGVKVAALLAERDRLRVATKILHMESIEDIGELKPVLPFSGRHFFVDCFRHIKSAVRFDFVKMFSEMAASVPRTSVSLLALILICFSLFSPLSAAERWSSIVILSQEKDGAQIEVRTARWSFVEIDGVFRGYTPMVASQLASGWHWLRWKTRHQQGLQKIYLSPGQSLLLTDRDLIQEAQ